MSTAFRITAFGGIAPRVAARLLADNMAQRASNLKITSGELGPIGATALETAPIKTMPPVSLFLARNGLTSKGWFTWPTDVDVVRAPLSVDVESRFYWTGDGEPRYATFSKATLSGLNDYPSNYWAMGVPTPTGVPTVTPSGGVGVATTRLYRYTFFSELGEESGASPATPATTGKVDDTWLVENIDAVPVSSGDDKAYFSTDTVVVSLAGAAGTITAASNATPIVITEAAHGLTTGKVVNINGVTGNTAANNTYANPHWTITVIDANNYSLTGSVGNAAYVSGGSRSIVAPHWTRAGDEVVLSATTLAVTSVTAYTFKVAGDYSAATTWARKAEWNTANMKRRLYRSAGTNATYQLVTTDIGSGTTYSDTILDKDILGDELISLTWAPPPVGLKGLITHPSGALIGFVGNLACMSEPYQPHAWPPEYQLGADFDIVGAAVFGSEIMFGTRGNPYIASGTEPASMSMEKTNAPYPCLSKRSIVPVGNGALYSSKYGMVFIGEGGFRMFTENHYTEAEWELLDPSSMFSEFANGRVYIGYVDTNLNSGMLIFDGGTEVTVDLACTEMYADPSTGNLYLGDSTGVRLWDSNDANPLRMAWRSKEFTLPMPLNFGAAKVEYLQVMSDEDIAALVAAYADAVAANTALIATGDIGGDINGETLNTLMVNGSNMATLPPSAPDNSVSFTLYNQDKVIFSRTVTSTNAFKLPSGMRYDSFSVEVTTQNKIRSILIGETIASLRAA